MPEDTLNFKRYVRRRRRELIQKLGGKCWKCGATNKLEVDHINGRNWEPRQHNQRTRINRYWKEYLDGVPLRPACKNCNSGYHPGRPA